MSGLACSRSCRERGGKAEQMSLMDGGSCSDDLESDAPFTDEADILSLPPMPDQYLCQMRAEACCGNTLVCFLIFLFVAPMQAYATGATTLTPLQHVWLFAIYAEAATAIFCLLGLMWGDPGTIKRTPANCFPLPDVVVQRLRSGHPISADLGNVREDDRVFCIRCLVWRQDDRDTHHCSTCQRCVVDFDHHCGVFGRCIAGDGMAGNMGYFKTLITMGVLGCMTCVSFMVISSGPSTHTTYRNGHRVG